MTPYADIAFANTYFTDRLNTTAWDNATLTNQDKALKTSTRAIDNLNFAGDKTDPAQENQFPRGDDALVPLPIQQACCELAYALLDGVDPNKEIESLAYQQQGLSDARLIRDTSFAQAHIRAGIPSIQAWALLHPFLRESHLTIERTL